MIHFSGRSKPLINYKQEVFDSAPFDVVIPSISFIFNTYEKVAIHDEVSLVIFFIFTYL